MSELNENLGADNVTMLKDGASMISANTDASGKVDKSGLFKAAGSALLKYGTQKLVE